MVNQMGIPCEQGLGQMMAAERGRQERWFPVVVDRAAQSRRPEGLGRERERDCQGERH